MKLTQNNFSAIKALAPPPGKSERRVWDDDLPGFGVRVWGKGKGAWIIQYRVNGRQTTKKIGSIAKVTPASARQAASRDLAQAELGTNPAEQKKEARGQAAETFKVIAARFLKHKEGSLKKSSFDQVETHLTDHWSTFDRKSIHEITRRDVAAQLGEIATERGPYAANRARATLSAFFTWTMGEGLLDTNPVIGTSRQMDEKARDRVLTDPELVAILHGCKDDDYGRIVRLLILTAQRRDEAGAIAKSEIDLAARKWTIPSARTKNGNAHEVPLSNPAIKILTAALAYPGREKREAVFGEGGAGYSGWSKAKAALDTRIKDAAKPKVVPWRIHDLRRTVATRMADLGVLPHVIEAVLNHISGHKAGVAGVYNRALYSAEKRQALDLWAAHIEALLAGRAASNIVPMKA